MRWTRKVGLASFALSLGLSAQGSQTTGVPPSLRDEVLSTWTTDQGLPQNFITALAQTPDGFLWVGTLNGLVRFDGLHFRGFEKDGPPELQEKILKLERDNEGGIWIATITALFHYTHHQFRAIALPGGSHALIQIVARSADGGVWIVSENKLMRTRGDAIQSESLPAGARTLRDIFETRNGTLWITDTEHVLAVKPDHSVVRYNQPGIQLFYGDDTGHLYAGDGHKLFRLEGNSFSPVPHPGLGNFVDVMVDHRGALWMASGGLHGLSRKVGPRTEVLTTADGLASDDVRVILEGSDQDVWVGTIGGLQRFHHGIFTSYRVSHDLTGGRSQTDAVFEQKNGAVWAGTLEGGVAEFKEGHRTLYGRAQGLPTGQVRGFAEHGATPAIAIADYGIFERHGVKFTRIPFIPHGYVNTPVTTSDGSLWFSVLHHGLFRLKDRKLSSIDVGQPQTGESIRYLATDRLGQIWAGTDTQLDRWTGDHFEPVVHTPHPILSVAWPEHGLAVATMRGLMLWPVDGPERNVSGQGKILTQAEGLPGSFILDVVADADQNLWVVTPRGIACLSREQWMAFAAGKLDHVIPEIFDEADGLTSNDVLPLNQVTATNSRDGRIWFATVGGIAVVNPHPPDPLAQAVLDYIQVDDHRLSSNEPTISPGLHRITFAYTAPSNTAPEQIRFRYRLAGWDRQWIDAGTERVVSYTGLPPGRYTFQVVATNREGVSNGVAAIAALQLQPFFWQTRWFLAFVILAVVGIAVELTRRRTKFRAERLSLRFQERAAERERIAYQIHDTVIQDMIGVAFQLELLGFQLSDHPETATDSLTALADRVRGSITRNRNMVSSLHSTAVVEYSLIEVLRHAEAEFRLSDLPEFDLSSAGEPRTIDPLVRDEVYRICREALSNAFRHAYAKHVTVKIQFFPDSFEVVVVDDGQGIDEVTLRQGREGHFGLRGMQAHAKRIGASLTIDSHPGKGTKVTLHVKTLKPVWTRWRRERKLEEESFARDQTAR
ncbi:two-component regulator propeller domain-containing protein [Granulicella sp. S190]|uniref:ligand-binding sensor domain-containing protein n=1 Tax=Granulicella sp. S190 TaxID=1747226 RepID=UPI00131E671B|nr:sensor histidine kinase [Granulicella sp. S190]